MVPPTLVSTSVSPVAAAAPTAPADLLPAPPLLSRQTATSAQLATAYAALPPLYNRRP